MDSEAALGSVPNIKGHIVGIWLKRPASFCISDAFESLLKQMALKSDDEEDTVFHRMRAPRRRADIYSTGLSASVQDWHLQTDDISAHDRDKRAILVQSLAHSDELAKAFPDLDASLRNPRCATFGENLTVDDSLNCDSLCLGDVLEVRPQDGSKERFLLQVTHPRRPCARVDLRHGGHGRGVRCKSAEMSLAGFFLRPFLHAPNEVAGPNSTFGTLREGDSLVLIQRPHPSWTLRRTSNVVYGYGLAKDPSYQASGWMRRYIREAQDATPLPPLSDEQMEDLRLLKDLPELPAFEWLEAVHDVLGAMKDFDETVIAQSSGAPSHSSLRRRSSTRTSSKNSSAVAQKAPRVNAIVWYCSFGLAGMLASRVVARALRK